MAVVTVPGTTGTSPVTLSASADQSAYIVEAIGAALYAASTVPGGHPIAVDTVSGSIPSAPTTPGTTQVLNLNGTAINTAIPSDWHIVYDSSSVPGTISGSNITLLSGDGGGLFNVSGNSTVAATGGDNTITAIGNYVIGTGRGDNVVYATGAGNIQTGGGTNIVVVNATVGGSAVQSGGTDQIVAYAGPVSVVAAGNHSAILGGPSGSITARILADDVTVSSGGTNLAATVFGSDALIFGGSGTSRVNLRGAQATIVGGSGAETVDASNAIGGVGNGPLLYDGTGRVNFIGGAGTATIVGGSVSGTTNVTVGTGGLIFGTGTNNASTIVSGTNKGLTTVFADSDSSVVFNSAGSPILGDAIFVAGEGNETLNAANSFSNNTFYAGSGSETISGGHGNNSFDFYDSRTDGGQDVITDFHNADEIYLIGYGTNAVVSGGSGGSAAVVTLSDNTTITFSNVTVSTDELVAHIHNIG